MTVKITSKKHVVWTELDSWGIPFGVQRLPGESNLELKRRLLAVMQAHGDASRQGMIDGLSAYFGINTYNTLARNHFYLNLIPRELNDGGEQLDIKVYLDDTELTQNIEYVEPKDWMHGGVGNYVFDDNAEGFIVWRDSDGNYTRHLEFLTPPAEGTTIRVEYWAEINEEYRQITETVDENSDLQPVSAKSPTATQIKLRSVFDSDFLDEHTKATGVPDEALQNIIADVDEYYPYKWGSLIWDEYYYDSDVNRGLLPSYYDGTSQSGDFASGTGHGNDLKVQDIDDFGQPKIHVGQLYYKNKEYYMYKQIRSQELDLGEYDAALKDGSGDYLSLSKQAPIIVRAESPIGLAIGEQTSPLTGLGEWFTYDAENPSETVFTLTAGIPSIPDGILVMRYDQGDVDLEQDWIYTDDTNTITLQSPLENTEQLMVTWPESGTRLLAAFVNDQVTGPNLAKMHTEGHRILMEDLETAATLNDDLEIVTDGDHQHYVKLTDPYEQDGTLHKEVLAESGNVAAIAGVLTPFDPESDGYMRMEGKEHSHAIVDGAVQSADITLDDKTILAHTHSITFPDDFGWIEVTPEILPHKPNPKAFSLNSKAAKAYLTTTWDSLVLDSDTYRTGSYMANNESGSFRVTIQGSTNPHTIFFEGGEYDPDNDLVTLSKDECPSLLQAGGKILVVGQHIPPIDLDVHFEKSVFGEWETKIGVTITALDAEGLAGVRGCKITLAGSGGTCVVDMQADNTYTDVYGRVYLRPTLSEGETAITKGDDITILVTGEFITRSKYTGPLPTNVTETEEGSVGDKTYTYTITKAVTLTWIGD